MSVRTHKNMGALDTVPTQTGDSVAGARTEHPATIPFPMDAGPSQVSTARLQLVPISFETP